MTRLCQELVPFFFQNWPPWRVRALGRLSWMPLLVLRLLCIGSLQLRARQGMRSSLTGFCGAGLLMLHCLFLCRVVDYGNVWSTPNRISFHCPSKRKNLGNWRWAVIWEGKVHLLDTGISVERWIWVITKYMQCCSSQLFRQVLWKNLLNYRIFHLLWLQCHVYPL